jgi:hypothetical protein
VCGSCPEHTNDSSTVPFNAKSCPLHHPPPVIICQTEGSGMPEADFEFSRTPGGCSSTPADLDSAGFSLFQLMTLFGSNIPIGKRRGKHQHRCSFTKHSEAFVKLSLWPWTPNRSKHDIFFAGALPQSALLNERQCQQDSMRRRLWQPLDLATVEA